MPHVLSVWFPILIPVDVFKAPFGPIKREFLWVLSGFKGKCTNPEWRSVFVNHHLAGLWSYRASSASHGSCSAGPGWAWCDPGRVLHSEALALTRSFVDFRSITWSVVRGPPPPASDPSRRRTETTTKSVHPSSKPSWLGSTHAESRLSGTQPQHQKSKPSILNKGGPGSYNEQHTSFECVCVSLAFFFLPESGACEAQLNYGIG